MIGLVELALLVLQLCLLSIGCDANANAVASGGTSGGKGFAKPSFPLRKRTSDNLLIVGLGNPGAEFEGTRHNVGFEVAEYLQRVFKADSFKTYLQFKAEYATGIIHKNDNNDKITYYGLLKPLTYMNLAGESVGLISQKLQVKSENILCIADDFNTPFGEVKLRESPVTKGSGSSPPKAESKAKTSKTSNSLSRRTTHNGLRSIEQSLRFPSPSFSRLNIGIGKAPNGVDTRDHVLQEFSASERRQLDEVLYKAMICVEEWMTS